MTERLIKGIEASNGLASGAIFSVAMRVDAERTRQAGTPDQELQIFQNAIKVAASDLSQLIETLDEDAADILEFQLALLEDEDFFAPATGKIAAGASVDDAWGQLLDAEIAEYLSSEDEYFRARTDDLRDLKARVLSVIFGQNATASLDVRDAIIISDELTPSEFLAYHAGGAKGFALKLGSPTSHVSVLARARGVALLVGCGPDLLTLDHGCDGLLDTEERWLIGEPGVDRLEEFKQKTTQRSAQLERSLAHVTEPAITRDGEPVTVCANVEDPSALDNIDVAAFDGVGLFRTEFLFSDTHIPDEDEQFAAYAKVVTWAAGRPVTIRTLDAGGDKPIKGVVLDDETNPFLGVRGYRLSRMNTELFRVQLRAIARAAALGPVKVMLPMVTAPFELEEFRALFGDVIDELTSEGVVCAVPDIGIMIEVPAAALTADAFNADFYSVGSNDLIQYTLAVARDNAQLSHLTDSWDPAVCRLIEMSVDAAKQRDVPISVCGDMASQAGQLEALLETGVRSISIAPAQIAMVKDRIRCWEGRPNA